jgi:hypothetical protein
LPGYVHTRGLRYITGVLFSQFNPPQALNKHSAASHISTSFPFTRHKELCLQAMLGPRALITASAAITLLAGVSASPLVQRNEEPPQPACTSPFQPFVYAGCFFSDPSSPRALLYDSGLPTQDMTVETCVAFCKGISARSASHVLSDAHRERLQVCRPRILWRMLLRCFRQWCPAARE